MSKTRTKLEIKINWYDRLIGFFSPKALVERKKAKLHNTYLARKFEGADAGRRTKGWIANSTSVNAELAQGRARLRDRARDLIRNNPYAEAGQEVITTEVVGEGIITQIKNDTRASVSNKERRLNEIWRAWANTPACDFEGRLDLSQMQELIMNSVVESGEVLVRLRRTRRLQAMSPSGDLIEVPPLKLQILESDFIASDTINRTKVEGNNSFIEGVEIDPEGRVVAYHLHKDHPGNTNVNFPNSLSLDTIRVPASEVLHIFNKGKRPGQLRGVSWFASVMLRLRDFDLYEDAQLKRQQCAAMFAAFVKDLEGVDDAEEEEQETELGEKMEPGIIELLPPGKDVVLADPPGAENYKEYTTAVLRAIATGLGITYESLTGDLSEVNFSSARMGFLKMQRNIKRWRRNIMIKQFLLPTFVWFKNNLDLIGQSAPNARAVFTPPRTEMVDPVKETQALKDSVRSGFKSQSEAVRELGKDPDLHFRELEEDNQILDSLNLILDTDPRKVNKSGALNESSTESQSQSDSETE